MSTLSGIASKGEKTKSKFQSLDINNLIKSSRGESTEKPAQKSSSSYIKHGMQSLGKVPSARRAPVNLPSIKSEHSESGAAVPLVPPGATGWGKQEGNAQSSSVQQNGTPQNNGAPPPVQGPQLTPHQQAIAIPSTNPIQHNKQTTATAPSASTSAGDKLWSTVMASGPPDGAHPPAYQSPQFQHEFPSLSAGDGVGGSGPRAPEYVAAGPGGGQAGLSLRPQTEGSWTQGGQRAPDGSIRTVSGPQGAAPQLSGPAGRQAEHLPPQILNVMPSFMHKSSFPQGTPTTASANHSHAPQSSSAASSRRGNDGRAPRLQDRDVTPEELTPRPIIREEDLNKLDDIGHDMGWAASDDIDYNQKLAFSDDESERPSKKEYKAPPQQYHQPHSKPQDARAERQTPPRYVNQPRSDFRGRSEEDDLFAQKQKQYQKDVDEAIQRAKQRKEEEEKRFNEESRQRAQKKLQELEEKVREKRDRDRESEIGTINPSAVPAKPVNHVEVPLPDFHKEKKEDSHSRLPNDPTPKEDNCSFRQMTQIDGKNFSRKPQQKPERDHRDKNGPSFSRHFQDDLPPRFSKYQRNNSVSQPSTNYQHYDNNNKWSTSMPRAPSRGGKSESPERRDDDRKDKDYKRQSSEDSYRSSHHSQQELPRSQDSHHYEDNIHHKNVREEDKWLRERKDGSERENLDKFDREKQERPQRPDSRDSYTSHASHTSHGSQGSNRRSRDSEMKESMTSWNEDVEAVYQEKHEKEYIKDEKRQIQSLVPGPITRDRIEAEDINEKRNLTQLKKGEIPLSKKLETTKKEEKSQSSDKLMWADVIPPVEETELKKDIDAKQASDFKKDDYKERQNRNNRSFSQSKGWNSGNNSDFHMKASSWGKPRPPSRSHKQSGRDFYGTDSDGSTDTHSIDSKDSKGVQKKNFDKEEKNRDNKQEKTVSDHRKQDKFDKKEGGYIPKGEPSRHGRGGGNNFRGSRMSGLIKRIEGYGPPPLKSPFGHHDDRDKKTSEEIATDTTNSGGTMDKIKQNQEALAAGIIGKSRQDSGEDRNKNRSKNDSKRNKSKSRKDEIEKDSNSENSDSKDGGKKSVQRSSSQKAGPGSNERRLGDRRDRNNPRSNLDKKSGYESKRTEGKPDPQNILTSGLADMSLKGSEDDDKNENNMNGDSEGFQEVKSKKTGKERLKGPEDKKAAPSKNDNKDSKQDRKPGGSAGSSISKSNTHQMTQQQIQNIPPLMSTPVNPPQVLPQSKNQYDQRSRQNKLPPRFVKQKMQKHLQQQIMNDVDINKSSPNSHVYGLKENAQVPPSLTGCAWDKPLGPQLRANENDANSILTVSMEVVKLEVTASSPGHGSSPGSEKILQKQPQMADKNLLDGSTAPVNTIIFENTNFKSAPGVRSTSRGSVASVGSDKARSKLDEDIDNAVFRKPINDLLQKEPSGKADPMQLGVFKEETDMKLDFFGTDLTHLTDDKSSKHLCGSKNITSVNSTICNADSLNMKIASVKKVWETSEQESEEASGISFGGPVIDPVFKGSDGQDDNHDSYSPGNNQSASTTNVCKVKPTQQVSSGTGQVPSSASQQAHSTIVGHPMLLSAPLSPPPMSAPAPVGVSLGPQPYATNQHLAGFQAATGQGVAAAGSAHTAQFNISAIPSPPTVLYNSTQQLQSASLYGPFLPPADQASVLGGQGHARGGGFGQYAAPGAYHGLGQATNSPYNTQSVYLPPTAHPPPTAQAPPELYPSINSFRISAATQFGQNQPLNNPTTVLISSTSNSLMSASVKPSSQPISAIGTKAGGIGQAYQQQSQQGQQVFMAYEPALQAANYLPGAGVIQRGPAGPPVQNSVVAGLQPSSSYYSGSTGGQAGYFQQPGNSTLPSAQLPQHQAGFGLQGNVFGTHNQSHTNTGIQGYQNYLSTHMQMAAALSAQQQFRSATTAGLHNHYLKGNTQPVTDQQSQGVSGQRPQQLKSPSSQEVLSSVFNSAPQIPSPKSRQNNKHTPQQSSPTSQRKYFYQGVGNQQNSVQQRFPNPIQRPVNFQQQQSNMNSVQNSGPNNSKHNSRNNPNKPPNKQYYSSQNNTVSSNQNDKADDSKVSGCPPPKSVNTASSDLPKDNLKEEPQVLKD